jgi:hypothetical protein
MTPCTYGNAGVLAYVVGAAGSKQRLGAKLWASSEGLEYRIT